MSDTPKRPANLFELEAYCDALEADRDAWKALLVATGRAMGCFLADEVSDEFLSHLPEEAQLLKARAEKAEKSAKDLEGEVRQMMWLGHGHMGMYGDDGEMQCSECSKFGMWDYKREPIGKVRETFLAAQMERASKPSDAKAAERNADLVRHQRSELHDAGLITDEEYAALVADSQSGQRVARLEGYDAAVKAAERKGMKRALSIIADTHTCGDGEAAIRAAMEAINEQG